ncbi:UNVERIFIED_CONTAM: hypothetical protein Sangu_3135600 [Sesamum angustifolium]|uniref:Uncharacterized protein n=1 Tax=Sesamum angustifolium TaxID=2727405 RepID=A0AAW2K0H2_9LAMI
MFIQTPAPVVDRVDDSPQPGKESGPKSTFGTNPGKTPAVVCTQESISKKYLSRNPLMLKPEDDDARCKYLENLDKKLFQHAEEEDPLRTRREFITEPGAKKEQ